MLSKEEINLIFINLKSVVQSSKGGVILNNLQNEYKELIGTYIPYEKLGYTSLENFLLAIPHIVKLRKKAPGELFVEVIPDASTVHLAKLISKQKDNISRNKKKTAFYQRNLKKKSHCKVWENYSKDCKENWGNKEVIPPFNNIIKPNIENITPVEHNKSAVKNEEILQKDASELVAANNVNLKHIPPFNTINDVKPIKMKNIVPNNLQPIPADRKLPLIQDVSNCSTDNLSMLLRFAIKDKNEETISANTNPKVESQNELEHSVMKIVSIQNLVRPFTLLELKKLLKETGNLIEDKFCIDKLRSKCLAIYETGEEALKTKNALDGMKWPDFNPKLLSAKLCSENEFETLATDLLQVTTSKNIKNATERDIQSMQKMKNTGQNKDIIQPSLKIYRPYPITNKGNNYENMWLKRATPNREHVTKNRDTGKLSQEVSLKNVYGVLFRKTKSTPCIYWLPLSEG